MCALEDRISNLERELGGWRRASAGGFFIVGLACLLGAAGKTPQNAQSSEKIAAEQEKRQSLEDPLTEANGQRTVSAHRIELLDTDGRARICLEVSDTGPAIRFLDANGMPRLELLDSESSSDLRFVRAGESVLALQAGRVGPAEVVLSGKNSSCRIGSQGISIRDEDDCQRVYLSLINGDFPVLGLSHSEQTGPPAVELSASGGSSSWKMHDRSGQPLVTVVASDETAATIQLCHPVRDRLLEIRAATSLGAGPEIEFLGPANGDGTGGILPRLHLGLDREAEPESYTIDRSGRHLPMHSNDAAQDVKLE